MKKTTTAVFIFLLLFTNRLLLAGGFQLNTQGQKATSMGGSLTGWALDASAGYYNPGSLIFLNTNTFTIGATAIIPRSAYLSPLTGKQTDAEGNMLLPIYYYGAYKLKEKIAVGLAINNPYGFKTTWSDDWEGKYITQEATLKTLYIQPTLSYKVSEKFGVGLGFVYAHGKLTYKKAIAGSTSTSEYGTAELEGKDGAIGINAGVFIKFSEKLNAGFAFRSKINLGIEDDATFTNIPTALQNEYPASASFSTRVRLPSVLSVGIGYQVTREIKVSFETNVTGWSKFDSLNFDYSDSYPTLNKNGKSGRKYKDAVAVRLGLEYAVLKKLDVRAGFAYDQSPVKNGYVTPDFPDANKFVFSGGVTFKAAEKFEVDFAYLFESIKERQDTNRETMFGGTYKTFVNGIGLGVTYKL